MNHAAISADVHVAAGLQDGFATSAFGRKPTFLGATLAGDEVVATGVVYKVTEEQYNKQVGLLYMSRNTRELLA
jgi:hypothetical protein